MISIIEDKLLKEKIYHKKLPNGLRVFVYKKPGFKEQFAVYASQYGSIDSEFIPLGMDEPLKVPDGIAHFLEHKLFEEEDGNIFDEYSKLGASPNASTSFDMTAYHFTSTGSFYEALDILLSFVGRPYFTDENVEKEKGIIGQELMMYEDNPYWRVFFNLLNSMYHEHPVKKDIGGTIDSISNIDKELLYLNYNTFYNPSNMVLFAAGDIDPEKVFKQAEEIFKNSSLEDSGDIVRIYPEEAKTVVKSKVVDYLPISRPIFSLGFKDSEITNGGNSLLNKLIANSIILDLLVGSSSDLYSYLYEEGLIDSSFGKGYTGENTYGFTMITGHSSEPEKVTKLIFDEIQRIGESPWKEEDFLRIKNKKIGSYIRLFDSISSLSMEYISLLFKDIELFDYYDRLLNISYEEVLEEFNKLYRQENSCLSLVLPKEE